MPIRKALITAANPRQRTLPLQTLIDQQGESKSALQIVLEVTVRGAPDPETGYIMDLGELKRILHTAVVDKCDHRNLNDEVDFLRRVIPSTENLVIAFWNEIAPYITAGRLHCVRLYETPRNFAEYHGPDLD